MSTKEVPIVIITGYLGSGKTTFIKELISRESFRIKGKTLLVLCEEGEIEKIEAVNDSLQIIKLI